MKRLYHSTARVALLALLATGSADLLAQNNHYRWLDDRGAPVYSDRPPPKGVGYEVVSSSSTFKRVVSADEGAVPAETKSRVGNEFDQVDVAAAQRSRKNPELCQRAENNLEALTSSPKVKVRNDQGEERYLSPEEIEVERQTAKAQISVYCQ